MKNTREEQFAVPSPSMVASSLDREAELDAEEVQRVLLHEIRLGSVIVDCHPIAAKKWAELYFEQWESAGWPIAVGISNDDGRGTIQIAELTCMGCKDSATCPSRFDLYNTNGDCLEAK